MADVLAAVQQPIGATDMRVTPENATVVPDNTDGFTYYTFPPQPIPAGEQYQIGFSYTMANPQLSVENLPAASSITASSSTPPAASVTDGGSLAASNINWPLVIGVLGLVVIAIAATWLLATRQQAGKGQKTRKPRPKRAQAAKQSSSAGNARYCHQCGNALNPNDKFCRNCGTAVKGT